MALGPGAGDGLEPFIPTLEVTPEISRVRKSQKLAFPPEGYVPELQAVECVFQEITSPGRVAPNIRELLGSYPNEIDSCSKGTGKVTLSKNMES